MFRTTVDFLTRHFRPAHSAAIILALAGAGVFLTVSDPGQAIAAFLDQPLVIGLATAAVLLLQAGGLRSSLRHLWRSGLVVAPVAVIALSLPALAQTAGATPAPSGFIEALATIFATVISSVLAWIGFIFQKRTGVQSEAAVRSIEMAHRDAIEKAATTAATLVVNAVAKGISKSEALSKAVAYLDGTVPDALGYFGLSNEVLATKIDAKLAELFGIQPLNPANQTPAPAPTA